ncbi:unnamed protein product [Mytilus coruscus]|uniref:WSC domain-containing protein n=1 Tax=Mytilus coruscus TaxID=42192 RepID=A0A6J8EYD3_MYTCO|nr:unnamed protein product [Mytilus coruscus]
MLDDSHSNSQMTLEICKQLCYKYRYLGLQSYYQCYCGNSLGNTNVYQKKSEGECNRECYGDSSQICGGHWRNSVYEFLTSTVPTTEMTTPGHSTVKTTEMTTPRQSTVTTTEQTTIGQSEVTTTDMTTTGKSPVTTLQITEPRASEVITFKTTPIFENPEVTSVQPTSPLECLCPCSKVGKGKWDFLHGMNFTLDQLSEILKPELDLMNKELSINKSNTTRMRRSKISVPDDRVSATSVGYVGVVFICLITVIIVFIDMLGCRVTKFKKHD